ncbi:MAG: FlgD immunoglobulin-like domain containing protein [bacterium]|nr:FlgD immunoglobulin-like domain containing protein [bacterium]
MNKNKVFKKSNTNRTCILNIFCLSVEKFIIACSLSCFLTSAAKADKNVWAWGYNSYGQLGDSTTAQRNQPVKTKLLTNVIAISAGGGYDYSLALKSDGTVWAWGSNSNGELGIGSSDFSPHSTPVQTSLLTSTIAISAGAFHSLTLKSDSTVWAFGLNNYGQLGDSTTTERHQPVKTNLLTGVFTISGGFSHSLALKSDGTVWAWGRNNYGQLGDSTYTQRNQPVKTNLLTNIIAISAGNGHSYFVGSSHSLALKSDSTVWAWGRNDYGQLGDSTNTTRNQPVKVTPLTGIIAISAGDDHSLALKSDGTVWAWGYNGYGQLGDSTTNNRNQPVKVNFLTNIIKVYAGANHSMALSSDGTVWAWGGNDNGQLGDSTITQRNQPIKTNLLTNIIEISGEGAHSLALMSTIPDTIAPSAPQNLSANNSNPSPWTKDSIFVISWTNPPDVSGIAKTLYKLNSAPTSNFDTTGSFHYAPDTVFSSINGTYTLYVWLVDSSGNVNYNNRSSVNLRYNNIPPNSFSLFSPLDSAKVNIHRPSFIWRASFDSIPGIKSYKIYIDDSLKATLSDTLWIASYDLTQGNHSWHLTAHDSADNFRISNTTWVITIDTTAPPIPALVSPDSLSITNDNTPLFVWHKSTGATKYRIKIDSDSTELVDSTYTSTPLSEGVHNWKVRAGDDAGNWSGYSNNRIVKIDTTAPLFPISLTADGSNPSPWKTTSSFSINTTNPTDVSGIARYYYKLGSAPAGNIDTTGTSLTKPFNVNATAQGSQLLYVWLKDSVGNVNYQNNASVKLRYDITLPDTFSLSSPLDSAMINVTTPTFIWHKTLEPFFKCYKIHIDGLFKDSILDTTWTANYNLTEGLHTWYVIAYDSAGNLRQSTQTWRVIADTTAPSAPVLMSPDSGSITNDITPTFVWHRSIGATKYKIKIDSDTIEVIDTTYTSSPLPGGWHIWFVKSGDNTGNWSGYSSGWALKIIIDTTAPSAPQNLTADSSNPSKWTNDSIFVINWTNPSDSSGITKALYKLGTAPANNYDTTGSMRPTAPDTVFSSIENTCPLYVWLVDSSGNVNYNNRASVNLRYDKTPPTGCVAHSINTTTLSDFRVGWSKGADGLSGLTGSYSVKVKDSTGTWKYWLEGLSDTFAIYNGVNKHKYSFEASAIDSAGNVEFTGTTECSTFVNRTTGDTVAPAIPDSVSADAGDREAIIYWAKVTASDLAGYNLYHKKTGESGYTRINSHIVKGLWFHDKGLFNDTTYRYVVTSIDTVGNESKFSDSVSVTPMDTFPPAPVSEFRAGLLPGSKVRLDWTKSPSYDCRWYNIYYDNATGVINYTSPLVSVSHTDTLWVSNSLTPNTTYIFGLRAKDITGNEEKNTTVTAKIKTVADTLGLVKARIKTPYSGKKISGNRVTVMAELLLGTPALVDSILFEYKLTSGGTWQRIIPATPQHLNPDTITPYFVHWDVSGFAEGDYNLRATATSNSGVTDTNAVCIIVTVDNTHPDEKEGYGETKIAAHSKRETVERMSYNVMTFGNESENTITRICIPELALEENTLMECVIREPGNSPATSPYLSADIFREVWLENGQEELLSGLESDIYISYVDSSLGFSENNLWFARYTGSDWEAIDYSIDTVSNIIHGQTDKLGTFFALLGTSVGTEDSAVELPVITYQLFQNTPNPFTGGTIINYQLPATSKVSLTLYDLTGREVRTLVAMTQKPGRYRVLWDGMNANGQKVTSGIYFYKMHAADFKTTKKLILMK